MGKEIIAFWLMVLGLLMGLAALSAYTFFTWQVVHAALERFGFPETLLGIFAAGAYGIVGYLVACLGRSIIEDLKSP